MADKMMAKKRALMKLRDLSKEWSKDKMKRKKDIKHDDKDLAYDIEMKDKAFKEGDDAEAMHYDRDEMFKSKGRDYDKYKNKEMEDKKKKLREMSKK